MLRSAYDDTVDIFEAQLLEGLSFADAIPGSAFCSLRSLRLLLTKLVSRFILMVFL